MKKRESEESVKKVNGSKMREKGDRRAATVATVLLTKK